MADPDRADRRPDPDALLTLARREGRGRLKVFLGAAPGVGKTYAMLQGAKRLRTEGADVVVGLVETHGRSDTEALLDDLDVLPRRAVDYQGHVLQEFDLDAAIQRRPRLLLVDELAHSNPPDSRHPKRWQDVEELLNAGIDVWTTLNVQHVESLADVVARITGISVRETAPDKVLNAADDVVLVDITPDELIARLRDGKVYLPETARRATQNFFTPTNLAALRELALRRTADRVDDQVTELLRQRAIEGPYGAGERLLVCIGAGSSSGLLIRHASRLAIGLNASWMVVHLSRPDDAFSRRRAAEDVPEHLQLAERLGARIMDVVAKDFTAEILTIAARENVTQIVLTRPRRRSWFAWRTSLADDLIRRAGGIAIHVLPLETGAESLPWIEVSTWFARQGAVTDVVLPVLPVAVAVLTGKIIELWRPLSNMSMIFLSAVLFCALQRGTRAAIVAAVLSFLAYNFFFIEPIYTFTVAEPHEVFALAVFLLVAILTGSLAGRVRKQTDQVARKAAESQALYEFSRHLSSMSRADDIFWAAAAHVHKRFSVRALLFAADERDPTLVAAWPPEESVDTSNMTAARWALEKGEAAGCGTQTLPNLKTQYRPLRSPRAIVGVCGFDPPDGGLSGEDERMLGAVLDQTAIAIDRAGLVAEAVKAEALKQNEAVRDALLTSLSHDLKTPLSSITGAVTTLRQLKHQMTEAQSDELLQSIELESQRLSRFVANLLDMSRIESGALTVRRDWVDVGDVVRAAADRIRRAFPDQTTKLSLEPELPFVRGDAALLEQVVFNLLDNAHKYGGGRGASVHARRDGQQVTLSVTDEGPGIRPADLEKIFEKFYRGGRVDGRRAGTGLGLSICRGLVEAMGGTIEAQSPAVRRRGTRILIRIPVA